jgi:hypothetical protein
MAETFQKTIQRTKFFNIGESDDPDATGPANYAFMLGERLARVHYEHAANDAKRIPLFRAEQDCEIVAAHVRPETGWAAGAASEDLLLDKDDGAGGTPETLATIDGTAQDMVANQDNEWTDATDGLPGVYAPGPLASLDAGGWLYLQQTTNGAGAVMGATTLEITYRYK